MNFQKHTIQTLLQALKCVSEFWDYDDWERLNNTQFHHLCVDTLNKIGVKTERGKEWDLRLWRDFRKNITNKNQTRREIFDWDTAMEISDRSDDYKEHDTNYRQVNYSKIKTGDYQSKNKPVTECEIIDWLDEKQIRKTKLDVVANFYTSNTQFRTSIDGLRLNSN